MKSMKTVILIFIIAGVLSSTSVLLAGNRAIWIEGEVTRAPWMVESHYMVEVNWKPYSFPADIRIIHRVWRNKKAYDEKIATVYSIFTGRKILMKVRNKEVVQIVLL